MKKCRWCHRVSASLISDTGLCPECGAGYTAYTCSVCGKRGIYLEEAVSQLPSVLRGLCGVCYRRSKAAELTDAERASIRRRWQRGDHWGAIDEALGLLDLGLIDARAVAYELSQVAEPAAPPDRGGD